MAILDPSCLVFTRPEFTPVSKLGINTQVLCLDALWRPVMRVVVRVYARQFTVSYVDVDGERRSARVSARHQLYTAAGWRRADKITSGLHLIEFPGTAEEPIFALDRVEVVDVQEEQGSYVGFDLMLALHGQSTGYVANRLIHGTVTDEEV